MINFIKRQFKKILIALGILGVAFAAPIIIDQPLDISEAKIIEKYERSQIKEHYKLQGAKFIKEAPNENEIRIEVGGVSEFEPALRLSRWDNEVHFKIKPNLQGIPKKNRKLDLEGNKIKLDVGKKEYHFYEIENAYEFEVILKEKPTTNIVSLSIETNGLDFFYQPELTQEEIDDGAFRPENVVGSYAVYHESKQGDYSQMGLKNYRAGKAFHIYRPKIIDAEGKEVWGDLFVDTNKMVLTVEIPQEFLNNAVYPVKHAAGLTFGYEVANETYTTTIENYIAGTYYQISGNGTADSITAYIEITDTAHKVKCAIYKQSDRSRVGVTEERTISAGKGWQTFNFSAPKPPLVSGTNYYLVVWAEATTGIAVFYRDYIATYIGKTQSKTYNGFPDPIGTNTSSYKFSIYCTYQAGGGADRRIIITN